MKTESRNRTALAADVPEQRLISAARWALYGSVAIVGACTLLLSLGLRVALRVEVDDRDYVSMAEVQDLQSLVRVDTTADRGDEVAAARVIASILSREGIESEIEELPGGKANLFAMLPGRTTETLILHGHLDTDPISRPEEWTVDPFGGVLKGHHLYGRGAFDMKSVTVAQVHAMLTAAAVAREEGPAQRTVLLMTTSSEETNSELGVRKILQERPDLVGGAWGVLGEGGVVEARNWEDVKYWGTSFVQKQYVPFAYLVEDLETAERLAADLKWASRTSRWPSYGEPQLNRWAVEFLRTYGPTRDRPDFKELLSHPEVLVSDPTRFEQMPAHLKALFRNERHMFPLERAEEGWRVPGLIHLWPGADLETGLEEVLPPPELVPEGRLTVSQPLGASGGSPMDHPVFVELQNAIARQHGDVPRGGYFLAYYANDCRFFRQAEVACYGFSPFLLPGGVDAATISGPDERITLRGFVEGVDLYRDILRQLLRPG